MAASKSKSYTISGSAASYVFALDNDLKIKGVYADGKILDPTDPQWNTVINAEETKIIWNQFKATSGLPTEASPDEVSQAFYLSERGKELNTSVDPKSIESSNNLFYSSGVVANPSTIGSPTQFASPSAINRSRTRTSQSSSSAGSSGSINSIPTVSAYPLDIDLKQDYIKFTKYRYERTSVNMSQPNSSFKNSIAEDKAGKYGGTVILPMPKVSDSNGAEWGDSDLNIFGVAAAAGFKGMVDSAKQLESTTTFGNLGNAIKGSQSALGDAAKFLVKNGAGAAAVMGSVGASSVLKTYGITVNPDELLARATGRIANPNAELLFQGPVLRDFGFQFLMVARSKSEGAEIRKIIKWFKQGAAPKYENQALLGTPDVFKLVYSTSKMNKFHQMALRTITVDYAPDGYWAAYDDSHPIAVVMNLQFTELKPVYDVDQEKGGDDVGY